MSRHFNSDDEIDELSLDYSQTSSAPNSYASSQTSLGSRSLAVREPKPLSVLGQLLNAYRAAKRNKGVMRQSVIDHIHSNAVSLADVQLLTPDYKHDYGFINKLSSTIAYHCAAGRISDADKETIFTHIFTHDDERSDVYNRVHARIEHFQKNMKHLHTAQRNRTLREKQERQQEEQSLATRIQEFPAHLRAPVPNPEFLPIGATTVADIPTTP
ncbi:hypothetical protein P171DRAFT_12038 [Karstenula rhodostoma CBS 690.94]|uniref:Uncharacterized protein n=1 Tax=Karstenula rhodostoma CBS 690.94 TaxID=1392251 RepID=A0A9P4PX07_9PLEO|nr:hypothetical protein P171DRAFT_12038 [Karstenula rhodostoma CBS 690.94]